FVANKPLFVWAFDPTLFYNSKSIFTCPAAVSQGIDPADASAASGDMLPSARPLFNYAMNSKSLANAQINNANAILKSAMIAHPSAFVLFSDVRNRSAENPYYGTSANRTDLATPHGYTTRFSARHSRGSNLTFSDGHAAFFKYDYVVADGIR